MSQDGRAQRVTRSIRNDRPNQNDVVCPCGGTVYASPGSRYVKCSGGEFRCTRCLREARKFGKGLTCGAGCAPALRVRKDSDVRRTN